MIDPMALFHQLVDAIYEEGRVLSILLLVVQATFEILNPKLYRARRRLIVCIVIFLTWWHHTSIQEKALAICVASCFSVLEITWYTITTELPTGEVIVTPGADTCREGYTTWSRYWGNVMFVPLTMFGALGRLEQWVVVDNPLVQSLIQIAITPLVVWIHEIILGYVLIHLFGRNVAWYYPTPDAYFHGNIRLGHYWVWICLGVLIEATFDTVWKPLALLLCEFQLTVPVLTVTFLLNLRAVLLSYEQP